MKRSQYLLASAPLHLSQCQVGHNWYLYINAMPQQQCMWWSCIVTAEQQSLLPAHASTVQHLVLASDTAFLQYVLSTCFISMYLSRSYYLLSACKLSWCPASAQCLITYVRPIIAVVHWQMCYMHLWPQRTCSLSHPSSEL